MALSGSLNTSSYDGRYYTLSWTATQSVADNQSTISWTLKAAGQSGAWYAERTLKAVIAGTTVYSKTDRVERYDGTVATGSIKLTHDSSGNKSFSASVEAAVYTSSVNCTGSGTFTLNQIPRQATLSSAPNFNDEGNPSITYSNPAGSSVTTLQACISLDGSKDDIPYRDISKTGTSYTFSLTDAERATLRNACTTANSRTVMFFVRTIIGGTTYYSTLTKTLSIVNATPTISATAKDTNSTALALTGDENKIIKGYNTVAVSMTATALKGATIKSYKISNGSTSLTASSGTFSNVENASFTFSVTDSRGNTASKTVTKTLINYVTLTANATAKMTVDGVINATAKGNYFNGTFGSVANSLTVQYRYKLQGGTYGSWTDATATKSGNTYNASFSMTGLNYKSRYVVQVRAIDKLNTKNSSEITLTCLPVFDWGEDDFNFNVPVSINGVTLLDIFYPVGSIFQSTEYFNPSEKMGGEWELLKDRFLLGYGDTYQAGTIGGKASVTLSAAIGATNSTPASIGYIAGTSSAYTDANKSSYSVNGASYSTQGSFNHSTPVTEHSSTSRDVSIMPPYRVVYMWERVA